MLALAAVLAVVAGLIAVYRSPLLTVQRYRLVGAKHLKLAQVLARAQVPADATLVRFPSAEVRARIAQDPWVSSVTIHRRLPDTVEFDVVERTPAAQLQAGNGLWLVDREGWVLAQQSADASGALPVVRKIESLTPKVGARITSPVLQNALDVLAGVSPQLRAEVRFVDSPTVDQTGLLTKENVDILFGSAEDLAKKDKIARDILAAQRGKVVFIDVRSTDRGVWRGIGK